MNLSLSNLTTAKEKTRKRRGRGDGSGRGTYSTRGMKGQRSRSGGKSGLKRRGLKQYLQQIPKSRGFKSIHLSNMVVNISDLEKNFETGEVINLSKMHKAGLIKINQKRVKVLGSGKIKKKLTVQAHSFSKSAMEAIKKAGGSIEIINPIETSKKEK
ncbi:50S ribosomal protein L15 [Patescibacteria group bacterium]|nr:50S ribosomal protein L15 [Patescibacteria group bacterium]MBU0963964.1 50S ribosomal protein L15 [Patescibacteria group bacterium]